MVKLISRSGNRASRILMITAMTAVLASCGGGAGDPVDGDTPIGELDLDNDGEINDIDEDDDDDDIVDLLDPFTDRDGDGLDDTSGLTEAEATVDPNEVTETDVCGGENGTDNNSSTSEWDDNCVIKRSSDGGQFADSFYAVGIQRVLYCEGYGSGANYGAFADGEYGPNTELAVQAFQRDENLTDDGVVGPRTWGRLRDRVELISFGQAGSVPDTYGFTDGPCSGIAMFYQSTSVGSDGLSTVPGAWELARNAPNETQRVPFSIEQAFGRL